MNQQYGSTAALLSLLLCCIASAGVLTGLLQCRRLLIASGGTVLAFAGFTFWNATAWRSTVPLIMLAQASVLGAWIGWKVPWIRNPLLRRGAFLGGSLIAVFWCNVSALFGCVILPPFIDDQIYEQVKSPDGRYTATLFYFEGGMMYGYYHVRLDAQRWHLYGLGGYADVAEVASEGLEGVSWRNRRTLVIHYDATRHREPEEDSYSFSGTIAGGTCASNIDPIKFCLEGLRRVHSE